MTNKVERILKSKAHSLHVTSFTPHTVTPLRRIVCSCCGAMGKSPGCLALCRSWWPCPPAASHPRAPPIATTAPKVLPTHRQDPLLAPGQRPLSAGKRCGGDGGSSRCSRSTSRLQERQTKAVPRAMPASEALQRAMRRQRGSGLSSARGRTGCDTPRSKCSSPRSAILEADRPSHPTASPTRADRWRESRSHRTRTLARLGA